MRAYGINGSRNRMNYESMKLMLAEVKHSWLERGAIMVFVDQLSRMFASYQGEVFDDSCQFGLQCLQLMQFMTIL